MTRRRWFLTVVGAATVVAVVAALVALVSDRWTSRPDRAEGCTDSTLAVSPSVVDDAPVGPASSSASPDGSGSPTAGSTTVPADDGAAEGPLRTVAAWDTLFARAWRGEQAATQRLSKSPDSWDHYTLAYSIDALTAAYRATGRTDYADQALRLTENVVASAVPSHRLPRSQYHDDYLGWASAREGGTEVPLFESYFWRYAAQLIRVVRDPVLGPPAPGLQARAEELLVFAQRNIADKWLYRGSDTTVYRSRTHMAAHWALIALNLSEVTSDQKRRDQYLQIVRAVDYGLPNYPSSLREQMVTPPEDQGAYFWSDVWGSCAVPGQDVAHGNGVIAYVVEAHDADVDWTDTDIAALVRTFERRIWPQPGPGAAFVSGSGRGTGWFSDGFVKLGRYDPMLQRRLETHQPANAQFYANGALNAALLARASGGPATATSSTLTPSPRP